MFCSIRTYTCGYLEGFNVSIFRDGSYTVDSHNMDCVLGPDMRCDANGQVLSKYTYDHELFERVDNVPSTGQALKLVVEGSYFN